MKKILGVILVLFSFITACQKDSFDSQKQAAADEILIKQFLATNNITNAKRDTTGIYYVISNPGVGTVRYTANTVVVVKYKLRLLSGKEIPQTTEPISFPLGQVIAGWQIGVSKIQPGGKIRLIIPSLYAYGQQSQGDIPANSVLDFDIELLGINSN